VKLYLATWIAVCFYKIHFGIAFPGIFEKLFWMDLFVRAFDYICIIMFISLIKLSDAIPSVQLIPKLTS
jgi:hypothetical protein